MIEHKVSKILTIILGIFIILTIGTVKVQAANANLTATKLTAEVGDEVKINLSFTAAAWNLKVNGNGIEPKSYASQTDDLSEVTKTDSIILDTSKAGTYTIKLTGDITDKDGNTIDIGDNKNQKVDIVINEKKAEEPIPDPEPEPTPDPDPTPEPTISNNAYLKELGIKPLQYDFHNFKQKNMNYTATVPYDITSVEAWYKKADDKQTVKITGGDKLEVGENTITVVVTAEDKTTTKTYKIVVTRQEEAEETSSENKDVEGLKSLSVAGLTLSQEFNPQVHEYNVTLTEDKTKLDINAEAIEEGYKVSVSGNENLKEGENLINIIVYDKNDVVVSIYQLNVNKTISKTPQAEATQEENNAEETPELKIIVTILLFVVIAIAVLIYVILHIKSEEDEEELKNNTTKEYNNFEDEQFKFDTEEIFEETEENIKPEKKKGKHF